MNAERLLKHYETIADAPDAIARLRRFILDLAVRGKLVPQDVSDEPASELLTRIAKEQARLVKHARIATPKKVIGDDPEFQLPRGWAWTTLGAVSTVTMGQSPPGETYNTTGEGVPLINGPVEFTPGPFGKTVVNQFTTAPTNFCEEGDLLICVRGSTTGRTNVAGFRACIGRGVAAIHSSFDDGFVRLFVWKARYDIIEMGRGIAFPSVSKKQVEDLAFPLPPLAEQHRIVAKVEELMGLCDRLEAARANREATRDRLAAASLARLDAPDPEAFQANARFALDALPALTTRSDQIKQLRQTILNLAVRGKLVPQDANDEPASELLKRIFALPWTKKRKLFDLEPDDDALADAFPLPSGWEWASVNALVRRNETVTYGILKAEWVADGVPTVRVTEMKTGIIDVARLPKCDRARAAKFQKTTLVPGDLLISKDGTIGKTAFVPPELAGGNITQHMLRFPICDLVYPQYIRLTIDAPFCQAWMAGETKGVALQGVNVGDFRRMPIPLPPLAEQHRIVAKVDALMALCDRLEASLTTTAASRRRLLDALLAEALAPAEDRELEAAE
ncbi:restriction endonuclease subunit S [Mesorhizobium sp. M0768]|uniref:restriction endonuclease subunit S n=1 Tax=Mesorhizobium sp. M0768 TaxID=2956996 RepID=UPI00333DB002